GPPAASAPPAATASTQPQVIPPPAAPPPAVKPGKRPLEAQPAVPAPEVKPVPPPPPIKPAKPEAKPAPPPPAPEVKPPPPPPPAAKPEVRPVEAKPAAPPAAPEIKPSPPPPAAKPVEAPAPAKPVVKPPPPAPAPAFEIPAEVAVPLWKKPAGLAIGAVVLLVLIAGAYFGLRTGSQGRQTPTETAAPGTEAPPTAVPQTPQQQQQALMDQAQKLADSGNYQGALAKLDEADKIQGPLKTRLGDLRKQINDEVQNAGLREIRQKESQIWTQAENHFKANRFDDAEKAFKQVLALPEGGRRRADAQRYIKDLIPQRKQEESLFAQGQAAGQQRDNEAKLQEADRVLQQVIAMNGPRRAEAQQLQTQVQQRLTQIAEEKGAAARQQEIATAENAIRQDIRRENFVGARQGVEQIRRLGGDPSRISAEIDTAEQQQFSQLEGQFSSARQQGSKPGLEKLVAEFRKIAEAGGPLASRAANYVNNQIPQAVGDIEAASRPAPTPVQPAAAARSATCSVQKVTARKYDRPVSAGSILGQNFIDGGVVLNAGANCGLPESLVQGAQGDAQVTLTVTIDEKGSVTDGRVLAGDASLGQSVLAAAKASWKFAPPKVNGTPVKTSAAVTVKF
ncbi:MAG: TonB family protein, partial [Candidatus Acidiferrales bacterium]